MLPKGSRNRADQDAEGVTARYTQRRPESTADRPCIPANAPGHDDDPAKCDNQCCGEDRGRKSGQAVNDKRDRSEQGKHQGNHEESGVDAALGARHVNMIGMSAAVL